MKHIVVGVDGSESSLGALRLAVELAASWDARLEALSVWQPYYGTVEIPMPIENLENKAGDTLAAALASIDPGSVDEVIRLAGVTEDELAAVETRERAELDRRAERFRAGALETAAEARRDWFLEHLPHAHTMAS